MEESDSDVAKNDRRYADESFAQFWAIYPRKVGKLAAKKKWDALRPTPALMKQIVEALAWQVDEWTDPQFVPHPTTWLNAGRWMDERPTAKRNGAAREIEPIHHGTCPHDPKCGSAWECQELKAEKVTT